MSSVYYGVIPASAVDPEKEQAAEETAAKVRIILGLPRVRILWVEKLDEGGRAYYVLERWRLNLEAERARLRGELPGPRKPEGFIKDEDGGFAGLIHPFGVKTGPNKDGREPDFYIHADALTADQVRFVVAHELKHLADFRDKLDTPSSIRAPQGLAAAERRADDFAERLTGVRPWGRANNFVGGG